jgi:tetratricopeptide (TPR) repeat protein
VILADIYIHAAMVNIMNNDYLSGFGKLMKANKNIRQNEEKYPGYWQNNKLAGVLNVSFASLSPFWRKVAGIFSLTGDAEKGFHQLDKYLADVKLYKGLHAEAVLYYGAVLKIAKDDDRAWKMLSQNLKKEDAPALTAFLASNLLYFTNRNEEALQFLRNFPIGKIEITFNHYDYLMGKEKHCRLDKDAEVYLKKYLVNTGLKNYSREICLKLAHQNLINGNKAGYELYLKKMDEYPKASIDRDREADIEKNIGYQPDINLLKSRYLAWGGYWNKTDSVLQLVNQKMLQPKSQKNEYNFLLASVRNAQTRSSEALKICDQLIESGKQDKDRFPAEAALLAGNICLNKNNFEKAAFYFNQTLKIEGNDDVYIEIIHRKAKNQLEKLKKI